MPIKPFSIAKISRPSSTGIFPRKNLFHRLDEVRQKRILWVSGPAGSGKTALVSSYLEAKGIPCLWLQLDEGDGDPGAFYYYLDLAARQADTDGADFFPPLTTEHHQGGDLFTRHYFETLCTRLTRPHALVFDNYQEVPENSGLHGMIVHGLEAIPEGIRVMFLSRRAPPSPFARLTANDSIHRMTWNDLRLSPDESQGIMRLKGYNRWNGCEMDWMHEKCEGWAAGIVLLLAMRRVHALEEWKSVSTASCREIFDYFADEVFGRLDEPTRSFLLQTAFLPRIHADAANRLTGIEDAEKRLWILARNQYFTTRSADGEPVYQYHQLFREFLLTTAREEWPPETLQRVQSRAAALLESTGQIKDAANSFLNARDREGVVRLIENHARSFISQGRYKTVQKWIEGIPKTYREKFPRLWYWLGLCRMSDDLQAGRKALQRAYIRFRDRNDPSGFFPAWSGIVETHVYERGDMHPLDGLIAEVDELLRAFPRFPSRDIEAGTVLGIFCAMMYRRPEHPNLELWAERLRDILFHSTDTEWMLAAGNHLLMYHLIWTGEHAKARVLLDRMRSSLFSAENITPLHFIAWRYMEGACLWYFNDFENSRSALLSGIETAEKSGVFVWNFMLMAHMVYLNLVQGKTDSAKSYLEKMNFILNTGRILDISNFYFLHACLNLRRGRLPMALECIDNTLRFSRKAGAPTPHHFFLMGKAEILIETGEYERADTLISETFGFGLKTHNQNLKSQCCWLWAYLRFAKGDEPSGFKNLAKHLKYSRKFEILNYHWWRSSVRASLFVKALEAGIQVDHVRRLIREHDIRPDPAYGDLDSWPHPVRIHCMGGFSILVDDIPLSMKRKGRQKPLELLKALIAFGGRDVRDELLSDALWPDADGESAYKNFTTTLFRLRKMIGHEQMLLLKGRRLSLNPELCRVDVESLECHIQEATRLTRLNSEEDRSLERISDKIQSGYQGSFLEGDDAPWILGPREMLRTKVLRALQQIGLRRESRRCWNAAVELYEKTIQLDPLAESSYQGLMRCHGEMSRKAEALAAYRRCRMALRRELDIAPSPETEKLREKLLFA